MLLVQGQAEMEWSLPSQAFGARMTLLLIFKNDLFLNCYPTSWLSLGFASRNATETQDTDGYNGLSKNFFDWFLYSYVHLPPTADVITGESWQLVIAVVNDGLTLCEWYHKIMNALILLLLSSKCYCVVFSAISKIYFLPLLLSSSCLFVYVHWVRLTLMQWVPWLSSNFEVFLFQEWMKSVGSHGISALLFVTLVVFWHFVNWLL